MSRVHGFIGQSKQVHLMLRPNSLQLMKGANLIAFVGRKRDTVANEKNSHSIW